MTIRVCDRCHKEVAELVTVTVSTRLGGTLKTPRAIEVCKDCEGAAITEIEAATTWVAPTKSTEATI